MDTALVGTTSYDSVSANGSPFSAMPERSAPTSPVSPLAIARGLAPFEEWGGEFGAGETHQRFDELLEDLRDEGFEEAVANLAEETEQAVEERFQGEAATDGSERERFARSWLAPLQFEAEQYLSSLETGLGDLTPDHLEAGELEERLDRLDPISPDLTPASEEFIGKLVRKAKKVVRSVAKTASKIGALAMPLLNPLLAPVLARLKGLIRPLLERVLRYAIGRLPQPLQPAARTLAQRLLKTRPDPVRQAAAGAIAMAQMPGSMGSTTTPTPVPSDNSPNMAPATPSNTDDLVESLDLSLAEAIAYGDTLQLEPEGFGAERFEDVPESHELTDLAAARGALVAGLSRATSEEDVAAEVEQFAPVLLAALRTGLRLVGRPKVVSLLAGFLGKAISPWVGPEQSAPLSRAIVDAGLRLASLETAAEGVPEPETREADRGVEALAGAIEDTVRRLAEQEDWLFEHDDLTEVAIGDAFGEAAATYFPQDHIRGEMQLAPSLGGSFVVRRPSAVRSYAKYDRVPVVAISARAARALPAFGGGDLAGAIRAAGGRFPLRARMHIYHARPGSTVAAMLRHDRAAARPMLGVFPLTRRAAGALLREPGLGVRVPPRYLRSHRRIAAGQRLYVLEPLDPSLQAAAPGGRLVAPGRAWLKVNPRKARITVGFYLSEPEAQGIAQTLRAGKGHGELLRLLTAAYRSFAERSAEAGAAAAPAGEDAAEGEEFATFVTGAGGALPHGFAAVLRERIGAWAFPALADWLGGNADAFERAAQHPDAGVRLRVRLDDVPGLDRIGRDGAVPTLAAFARSLARKPTATIVVASGSGRA